MFWTSGKGMGTWPGAPPAAGLAGCCCDMVLAAERRAGQEDGSDYKKEAGPAEGGAATEGAAVACSAASGGGKANKGAIAARDRCPAVLAHLLAWLKGRGSCATARRSLSVDQAVRAPSSCPDVGGLVRYGRKRADGLLTSAEKHSWSLPRGNGAAARCLRWGRSTEAEDARCEVNAAPRRPSQPPPRPSAARAACTVGGHSLPCSVCAGPPCPLLPGPHLHLVITTAAC